MPTIDQCITAKADAGLVNKTKADEIAARYREMVDALSQEGKLSSAEAERIIGSKLSDDVKLEKLRKLRMRMKQAAVIFDIKRVAQRGESNGIPVDISNKNRIAFDPRERNNGANLDSRQGVIRGQAQSRMSDFLKKFRSKKAGLTRDLTDIDDVVRERFGTDTGNSNAKAIANGMEEAFEFLRLRYNAAGGDILQRSDWGVFQSHDAVRVAGVPKNEWINYVTQRLDLKKMQDGNGLAVTGNQLDKMLGEVYDSIKTGGRADVNVQRGPGTYGSSVNRRANHRFLVFKDGDNWLEYQKKFGSGSLHDHITKSIEAMSRDVAELEILGPYPQATIRFMEQLEADALKRNALSATGAAGRKAANVIGKKSSSLQDLYNTVSGKSAIPSNAMLSKVSETNRNVVIASALGSSFFLALGDFGTQALTSRMNGLSVIRTMGRTLKTFVTNSTADRLLATRLGFTSQGWASTNIGAQRLVGETMGTELSSRVTDTVLRASFLSPLTESGRYGFQMEFMSHITGQVGKGFDDISGELQRSFKRHGITPQDWDIIRASRQWVDPEGGSSWVRFQEIADGEFGTPKAVAADKLQAMVQTEMGFAVISATPQVRTFLTGGTQSGTFMGEVLRNTALLKGFPMTVMHQHFSRMAANANLKTAIDFAVFGVAAMTAVGMLGIQLKQITSGKDPRDMSDPAFMIEALVSGGSLGMLTDILLQDHERFGGSLMTDLLGPVFGEIDDISALTLGNIGEALGGDDTNAGRELSRFVQKMAPGQSLWYGKLVLEKMLFEQLDQLLDPQASQAFTRTERQARKDYKQRYWWRPGRNSPSRAPDLSQALGG